MTPDRLQELADADAEGRVKILPVPVGTVCGTCGHWSRHPGTCRGDCEVRPNARGYNLVPDPKTRFYPMQSHKACKRWTPTRR